MTIGNSGRDLCLYLCLLPFLDFFMASPRIIGRPGNKQRGAVVALSVLGGISAVKLGYEMQAKEESYYDLLDVLPSCPSSELKKGFKRASLKVHPDKRQAAANSGEGGGDEIDSEATDEAFLALKHAYDTLSDTQKRDLYDKFGKPGLEFDGSDTTKLFTGLGFFYVMWLALAYLLTRRKSFNRAQTWSFTGLMAMGIFEYQACILSFDFLQDQLPQLAMFEKIELLHRIYPVYLMGGRCVAWLLYEDLDAHAFVMLQQLHWKVDRLRERLAVMAEEKSGAGAEKSSTAAAIAASSLPQVPKLGPDGAITAEMWAELAQANAAAMKHYQDQYASGAGAGAGAGGEATAAGPAGVNAAVAAGAADAVAGKAGGMPPIARKPPPPNQGGGGGGKSIMSLVWFFGVYFFFQWLTGRGGS